VRAVVLGSVALLVAGLFLVAWSVVDGGASVALLVVIPVISGSSLAFLLGVVLLIAGFFSLPFTLAEEWEGALAPSGPTAPTSRSSSDQGGAGGFVLIGPVPIVFGTWKGVSRRTRWLLALAGGVLFTLAIVAFLVLVR